MNTVKGNIKIVLILLTLFGIVLVLTKKQYFQQPRVNLSRNIESTEASSGEPVLLCYRGSYFNGSCLSSADINNDGVQELVYQPKGISWSQTLIILKEKVDGDGFFELFCKNCSFSSQFHLAYLKDLNGDKKMEVVVPAETLLSNNANEETKYQFSVYSYKDDDFVIKDRYDLPDNNEERNRCIEELMKKY